MKLLDDFMEWTLCLPFWLGCSIFFSVVLSTVCGLGLFVSVLVYLTNGWIALVLLSVPTWAAVGVGMYIRDRMR